MFLLQLLPLLLAVSAETQEEAEEVAVTEYSTTFLNISWVDTERQAVHTETSETGRYSVAGAVPVVGELRLLLTRGEEHLACTAATPFPPSESAIIALVQRGGCEFDTKVAHAVSAGAAAVIIYNNVDSRQLQTVQVVEETEVPVVFTFQWKGEQLVKLLEEGKVVTVGLEEGRHCVKEVSGAGYFNCARSKVLPSLPPVFGAEDGAPQDLEHYTSSRSVMFVSISFIVLMMISLAWLLFYYVQRFRVLHAKEAWERRMGRQARRALNSVELVVVGEEAEEAECTVCLDTLVAGEETRRLPCSHVFHRKCIDHWLLTKRKCPLCNLNIIRHFGLTAARGAEDSDEASVVFSVTGL